MSIKEKLDSWERHAEFELKKTRKIEKPYTKGYFEGQVAMIIMMKEWLGFGDGGKT